MKKNNIILSIIIPTKNRYTTLLPVLDALCKNIEDDKIEFIIQDNSDDNIDFINFQKKNTDHRIDYEYIFNENFSIKDNTERAVERIKGKYALFIGDDDLVSPYIVDIVEKIEAENIDCLIYDPAYYWWDTVDFIAPTFYHQKRAFWYYTPNLNFIKKNSKKEIDFLLKNGAVNIFGLPRFYHGILKTEILQRIKTRTGYYLNGSSPDMAFAMSIALEIEDYYHIMYPVSVYGASKNSGGGWTAEKKHHGRIEDQKHLPTNILEIWDSQIPKIWTEHTIYAETVSEILRVYNDNRKINYSSLYATLFALSPELRKYVVDYIKFDAYFSISLFKRYLGQLKRELQYNYKKFGFDVISLENVDKVMNYLKSFKL